MTAKGKQHRGMDVWYDDATQEYTSVGAHIQFSEDFQGAGHTATIPAMGSPVAGYPWVKKTQGTPTGVAAVANAPGGQLSLALAATSEKEEASLTQNDQLTWNTTKTIIYQAWINLSVLPSAAGVQAVWGLSSAWIDGPNNASYYVQFGCTANGAVSMRVQDGVSQRSVASGVTVTAGTWHLYRIEVDFSGVLHFFIDGIEYSTSLAPLTWGATGANALLQPYHSVYKPSGTGVATMLIDSIDLWSPRG